jgi:hypothetical protein
VGSSLLKISISGILASLEGSAYHLGKRLFTQAMGRRVQRVYALLESLFEYSEGLLVSVQNGKCWP